MNEYLKLLILSYFKDHVEEYSFEELMHIIGVSTIQFDKIIDEIFEDELLKYDGVKIVLTFKGRVMLMNSSMEEYSYDNYDMDELFFDEKWPLDKPFLVNGFSRAKWRNS